MTKQIEIVDNQIWFLKENPDLLRGDTPGTLRFLADIKEELQEGRDGIRYTERLIEYLGQIPHRNHRDAHAWAVRLLEGLTRRSE